MTKRSTNINLPPAQGACHAAFGREKLKGRVQDVREELRAFGEQVRAVDRRVARPGEHAAKSRGEDCDVLKKELNTAASELRMMRRSKCSDRRQGPKNVDTHGSVDGF